MSVSLNEIEKKIANGDRITEEEALLLYEYPDLHAVGRLASMRCEAKNGKRATYVINRYLNYSNICILSCQFCAFAKKKKDSEAFEFNIEELVAQARQSLDAGITELHIVGGLHPSLPFEYYTQMLRELKKVGPSLHLKVFTAIEILHLAQRIYKKPVQATLEALREAGLDSLTGGGAEILDQIVRDQICKGKESPEEWLDTHRTWHKMGGKSTCTMLFGHIETYKHRVDHLRQLRELQDETHGFSALIPFAFEPAQTHLSEIPKASALDQIRNLAVSRIYLDNFDHITAYWISMGMQLAQIALSYGADDLHGTIFDEKIFHMAGSKTPLKQTREDMEYFIREAGKEPVQRDSFYRPLAVNQNKIKLSQPVAESKNELFIS